MCYKRTALHLQPAKHFSVKQKRKLYLAHNESEKFKDPVLPIMHCALAIIGGHFLDVEKSEKWCSSLKSVYIRYFTIIALLIGIDSRTPIIKEHFQQFLCGVCVNI